MTKHATIKRMLAQGYTDIAITQSASVTKEEVEAVKRGDPEPPPTIPFAKIKDLPEDP